MNAVSGMDQPPEGTSSTNNTSRRTFLKGAALAGAAGLAAPFLASTSARASGNLVLGIQAPGPWMDTDHGGYVPKGQTWHDTGYLPHALGCRAYRDTPFTNPFDCPNYFPGYNIVDDLGNHVAVKPVASIRPDPTVLLDTGNPDQQTMENQIKNMIWDGAQRAGDGRFAGPPRLTVWHEAGNLYTDQSKWGQYGVVPGTSITLKYDGTKYGAAALVRAMHVKMQKLVNDVNNAHPALPNVTYGCIIYGQIDQMASDTDDSHNFVPNKGFPLDWYGIDVYYDSEWGRGDLNGPGAVANYMGNWLQVAKERSGSSTPVIHITECNANASDDAFRPDFFSNLAAWLSTNGGASPHMLTFFPNPPGPHSISWGYPDFATGKWVPPSSDTVIALQHIQATYG